jgi:hypothetical protein
MFMEHRQITKFYQKLSKILAKMKTNHTNTCMEDGAFSALPNLEDRSNTKQT